MEPPAPASPDPVPAELCGYAVDGVLTPGQSYLAAAPGGRPVVLKRMDEDCLLGGGLHPSIKERLCRIRELAHGGVANLHGVGREGNAAFAIWEYVRGTPFDQYVASPDRKPRELLVLARELILGVDALHARGIVHGAIGGGNVVVVPDGSIRLTHVSPLLYTDTAIDVEMVLELLGRAVERRGEQSSPLGNLIAEAGREPVPLKTLGTKVTALLNSRDEPGGPQVQSEERQIRGRTLVAAAVVTVVGLALGYGAWRMIDPSADVTGATWHAKADHAK